ncbi:SHOCT domain-containing protein [Streptomyces novaecaesareae]|uniref:SHOCT domain-containing protein n=1 Tax=Streptomyces novaecaesareae TaxID=68244 RepID=UPI0004ABCF1A|nr:SHOCT domain-containing protein [Streptomyces novaecaesareae]
MRHWHGFGHDHGVGGWGIGLMAIGTLLVLAVLVLLAVALFRYVSRTRQPVPHGPAAPGVAGPGPGGTRGWASGPTPEQLLAERFAKGEIDAEEYRHRLDTLRSANGPGGRSVDPGGS